MPDVQGTHGEDAFIPAGEKHPFEEPASLIVEERATYEGRGQLSDGKCEGKDVASMVWAQRRDMRAFETS